MNFQEFKKRFQKQPVKEYPNNVSKKPRVSVCVQTFQHKRFISECLENILSQKTSFDYEVLLAEDESTDGTREICIKFAEKYPHRIRLFLHSRKNQIQVLNEATGNFPAFYNIYSARGSYISICEGDDYWTDPLKLQKQVDFLDENSAYCFSYHNYQLINENAEKIQDLIKNQPELDIGKEELVKTLYHPLFLCICFRNNIKNFPPKITEVINVDTFLLSLLGQLGKAKFQKNISPSIHRIHSSGIWGERKKDKKFIAKFLLYTKLEEYYTIINKGDITKHFKKLRRNTRKMLIFYYLKNGQILKLFNNYFTK